MSSLPDRALFFSLGAAAAAAVALAVAAALHARRAASSAELAVLDSALGAQQQHRQGHPTTPTRGAPASSSSSRRSSSAGIDSAFPTGGASLKPRAPPPLHAPSAEQRQVAPPVIVGVAGASGSGKTCVAQLIEARLQGVRVVSISSDSYYKGLLPGRDAAEHNWDHPDALDMDLLAAHLGDLRAGRDVTVPEYDFSRHQRCAQRSTFVSARDTDVVIVDGIFVLAVEQLRSAFDLTLFTVEELDVCLARRLRRDIAERGRSIESVLAQYLRFVRPGYVNFIEPVRAAARRGQRAGCGPPPCCPLLPALTPSPLRTHTHAHALALTNTLACRRARTGQTCWCLARGTMTWPLRWWPRRWRGAWA